MSVTSLLHVLTMVPLDFGTQTITKLQQDVLHLQWPKAPMLVECSQSVPFLPMKLFCLAGPMDVFVPIESTTPNSYGRSTTLTKAV